MPQLKILGEWMVQERVNMYTNELPDGSHVVLVAHRPLSRQNIMAPKVIKPLHIHNFVWNEKICRVYSSVTGNVGSN